MIRDDKLGTLVVELLSDSVAAGLSVHFPERKAAYEMSELWAMSTTVAGWLHMTIGNPAPVAAVLDSSPEAIAIIIASLRTGRALISLPSPPLGWSPQKLERFLTASIETSRAEALLVPGVFYSALPPLPVATASFQEVFSGATSSRFQEDPGSARLIQYTSGSTADPKGVVVEASALGSNVMAILEWLEVERGDVSVSWLPLSHDMGLVGMTIAAMCAGGPSMLAGGDIVLMRPETFLRRPASWLEACSHYGGTITAAPDFAYSLAARHAPNVSVDLRRLRAAIIGAEPIRPATLSKFSAMLAPAGFQAEAFCPAYGLAEVGVAISMCPVGEPYKELIVDPEALAIGTLVESSTGQAIVSSGPPLPGYEVSSIAGSNQVGPLILAGPSLFSGYTDGMPHGRMAFRTSDLGAIVAGEVYVLGRSDDVVLIAGRNVYLSDVEFAVTDIGLIRPGRIQAFATENGYGIAVELGPVVQVAAVLRQIRICATQATGVVPVVVGACGRRSLPRTASGKPRRGELANRVRTGAIELIS